MAMFLIAGSFRITGAQPDGDSIRFAPSDPAKWDLITGPNRVKRNASGAAQLRLDAIDALEIHYGSPRTHQPLSLAHAAAAAELLDWLGPTAKLAHGFSSHRGLAPRQRLSPLGSSTRVVARQSCRDLALSRWPPGSRSRSVRPPVR
jgi:hypothetical protein